MVSSVSMQKSPDTRRIRAAVFRGSGKTRGGPVSMQLSAETPPQPGSLRVTPKRAAREQEAAEDAPVQPAGVIAGALL